MAKVIVEVKDGMVMAVYSTDADLEVSICDWDNAAVDENDFTECKALEEEINNSKLYTTVY